ncbi:MAG TPA: tetratricopeptide repeat protein [Steroidobacteraceae bacterium]|jgi:tetratricopeptide (TPR) repeat protein|nr:tetratricopeptide repeat protein [Steroidobacteraceae bacterium]
MRIRLSLIAGSVSAAWLMWAAPAASAHGDSDPVCTTAGQLPDVVAARSDLQRTPDVLTERLHLADLLVNAGCFDEAIHVLEAGQASNPRSTDLQYRLTRARSMMKEKEYFEGIDQAEAAARLRRNVLRCTQLSDLEACDAVLSVQPGNADIVLAKGNALSKAGRLDDAVAAYTQAAQLAPGNTAITAKLQQTQAQRQASRSRCTDGTGEAALQACQSILVKGASNEFDLTLRIANLQQSTNQVPQSLDSYIAANALRPGDKSVALAILALLDSTQRKDAIALAARGSALLTLGRPTEAVAPLRQAYALAPTWPDIAKQLAAAEALSKESQPHAVARAAETNSLRVSEAPAPRRTSYSNLQPASRAN